MLVWRRTSPLGRATKALVRDLDFTSRLLSQPSYQGWLAVHLFSHETRHPIFAYKFSFYYLHINKQDLDKKASPAKRGGPLLYKHPLSSKSFKAFFFSFVIFSNRYEQGTMQNKTPQYYIRRMFQSRVRSIYVAVVDWT